ncbi:hypothetical protein GCM10022409_45610 [Hymenobacter glaciei]|uniref:Uncharacterized protein n=2 Tax=Hymenobacter glaciei TaxID=877209 RepID=A0ABP7UV87_9BACT
MAFFAQAQTTQTFVSSQNNKLEREEAIRMLDKGNSTITGKVFARDIQTGIKALSFLNTNEKQYAPTGTEVILIPYTAYFKEYLETAKKQRKRGKWLQLPNEAVECMKFHKIDGGGGKFVFDKLMPGKYVLYTHFGYIHTIPRTRVVGKTDHYVNGVYQNSSDITSSYGLRMDSDALVEKLVTIDKDGEVKEVNLKKAE